MSLSLMIASENTRKKWDNNKLGEDSRPKGKCTDAERSKTTAVYYGKIQSQIASTRSMQEYHVLRGERVQVRLS